MKQLNKHHSVRIDICSVGQLQDAFSCYERAVKVKSDTISHHQGLLRCLMGLDQSNTALTYATGLLNERPEWSNEINPFRVESAWKLADWDGLSEFLKLISFDNWEVAVGKITLSVEEKTTHVDRYGESSLSFYRSLPFISRKLLLSQ
ncbi:serine/threonine-protein kinase atr-like isoform X2 [Tachypleus tridentatus]|uniref:serine/threonine-protein kinase atr-like isoform X2 n=1 Tax=Tachypleus tridentatus TaxID=6853 RepID=UPI003FCFCC1A